MKVGSSPLYYIPGQEPLLENFSQHLNNREKEALILLREKKILEDTNITPINRVALRAIKDFAIPLNINLNGQTKLFWKHFQTNDEEIKSLITSSSNALRQDDRASGGRVGSSSTAEKKESALKPTPQPKKTITTQAQITSNNASETNALGRAGGLPNKPIKKPVPESEFSRVIKSYLQGKDLEILEIISEKKRELEAKVSTNTLFGKQSFYLSAKDKKSINDNDLSLAIQKAQTEKMPALLISPGKPNKKAQEYLEEWDNLVKFEQIK
ncbi:hypothetical protein CMI47_16645 [Candidatus Pacearchaeota archaeon]|nr:hypothetical protein [Candidatus Pacearchaeota archaeon]